MMRALSALAIAIAVAWPATAAAQADYEPHNQGWNGLASFVGLAEGMGFEVDAVSTLEWGELSATDILVIVFPLQRVEPGKLGAFINAGGNVIIADDVGSSRVDLQACKLEYSIVSPK